jgi:hypothetical protein
MGIGDTVTVTGDGNEETEKDNEISFAPITALLKQTTQELVPND